MDGLVLHEEPNVKLPTMVVNTHIASGALVDIMPTWSPTSGIVHAVFASRRGLLPSVRSFIDFLAAEYGDQQRVTTAT